MREKSNRATQLRIKKIENGVIVAEGTFKERQKKVPDFEKAVKLMGLDD
jgi:hypothetical protein